MVNMLLRCQLVRTVCRELVALVVLHGQKVSGQPQETPIAEEGEEVGDSPSIECVAGGVPVTSIWPAAKAGQYRDPLPMVKVQVGRKSKWWRAGSHFLR